MKLHALAQTRTFALRLGVELASEGGARPSEGFTAAKVGFKPTAT